MSNSVSPNPPSISLTTPTPPSSTIGPLPYHVSVTRLNDAVPVCSLIANWNELAHFNQKLILIEVSHFNSLLIENY